MVNYEVPFVPNEPDNLHCLQAAYMIIAKYFDPSFNIPMDEWSKLTGFEKGMGTWANAGLVWFKEHGYDVHHLELFDFEAFTVRPKEYMIEMFGQEAGDWGYKHTNVPAEIERMKKAITADVFVRRNPTMKDMKKFINDGYLVRLTLNANVLNGRKGYVGHAVAVIGYNDGFVTLHDPGLPAIPNRQVTFEKLEAAWGDQGRELDAIRRV